MATAETVTRFAAVEARTGKEIKLAMQKLWLTGRVVPVGARLWVHHLFRSSEKKPLEVIYAFGLPRDAALRRFRVKGEGFSVHSELKVVEEAVKAYEAGIEAGRLSTLARQHGDGIVNLTLGNLRPGETVEVALEILAGVEMRDDGLRFRFPFTLAPGYHRQARAVEAAPGFGEMELPEEEFGDVILPRWATDTSSLHEVGFDLSVWMGEAIEEAGSPSHAVRIVSEDGQRSRVRLAPGADVPDRDLVLDVRTRGRFAGALAGVGRDGKGHFAAVAPSSSFGEALAGPRRVVLVLDRSGSMSGTPIRQALKAAEACLGALAPEDRFGVVAFDDKVESFRPAVVEGSRENREAAREFLRGIDARGGTELAAGIQRAAALLSGEGGDVLVLTDGQVFGTEKILESARAAGIRIHCLGIGGASQDRFLALLARETGGVSRFLTPRERVDMEVVEMFASISRPVASNLEAKTEGLAGARIEPEPPRVVFAGTPLVVFGESDGAGEGRLALAWDADGGRRSLEVPVTIKEGRLGETLRLLRGARLITDLESRVAPEGTAVGRRERQRIEKRLETLSEAYGLASRRMSLVAVVERAGDQPGVLPQTLVVPVGMPQDTEFTSYFGGLAPTARPMRAALSLTSALFSLRHAADDLTIEGASAGPELEVEEDLLLELAAHIDPDGGMPGDDDEDRVLASIVTLLAFLAEGHTSRSGAFRRHVQRLIAFLESAQAPADRQALVGSVLALARRGQALPGEWLAAALDSGRSAAVWGQIERAVQG
ncbi:MAG: VWA domain-containing protein [Acidobacteriota bacterium]